ncbi:hypothetical protein ABTD49_19860, partial [Acinetobacter baumannii]
MIAESRQAELPVQTDWKRDDFKSVYRDAVFAHLIDVPDQQAGLELGRQLLQGSTMEYFRVVEVMRDYGMFDRTEAPQYYPAVA